MPVVRKPASRQQQDNLESLIVSNEEGIITIRSESIPVKVKPRPRTTQTGHIYMPADYMEWKRTLAGKVAFRLKSCPVYKQERLSLSLWVWSGRGDADNLAGGIMDAFNGIVWFDDDQVIDLIVHKRRRNKSSPRWLAIIKVSDDAEAY